MAALHPLLIERADRLLTTGGRLLGIAGPPGAGKSTLAEQLLAHYGTRAQLLPMDGFHMANGGGSPAWPGHTAKALPTPSTSTATSQPCTG